MPSKGAIRAGMLVVQEVFFTEEREPAKVIDAIAAIIDRETHVAELVEALKSITLLIGNVDHSTGNGANAARMRGQLLNDIRTITDEVLSRMKGE